MDVEGSGGRGVAALMRFTYNIMNFSSLSLFGKIRTISIPVLVLGMPGYAVAANKLAVKKMNISGVEVAMVDSCIAQNDAREYGYSGIISTKAGCSCVTKMVRSESPESHMSLFDTAYSIALDAYEFQVEGETDAELEVQYKKAFDKHVAERAKEEGVNESRLGSLAAMSYVADMICDDMKMYYGESLTQIASLEPFADPIWKNEDAGKVEVSLRGAGKTLHFTEAKLN